jgi:hypothetical protein
MPWLMIKFLVAIHPPCVTLHNLALCSKAAILMKSSAKKQTASCPFSRLPVGGFKNSRKRKLKLARRQKRGRRARFHVFCWGRRNFFIGHTLNYAPPTAIHRSPLVLHYSLDARALWPLAGAPPNPSLVPAAARIHSRRAVYHVIATRVVRATRPSPCILGANLHNFNQNLLRTSSSSRAHTPQRKLAKNDNEMGPVPIF